MTMVSESDARKRWCPFARVVVRDIGGDEFAPACNRVQEQERGKTVSYGPVSTAKCLASDCMAWRWNMMGPYVRDPQGTGYCGLAGRPA